MNTALKVLALLGAWLAMAPSVSAQPALLGTTEFRAPSLAALPQWQGVLQRIEAERSTYRACADPEGDCPSRGAAAWQAMIRGQVGRPRLDQLDTVNRFLNNWRYKEDSSTTTAGATIGPAPSSSFCARAIARTTRSPNT